VLLQIKELKPETIVLIITGYSDIQTAVSVIRMGAYDYLIKPLVTDELLSIITKALPLDKSPVQPSQSGLPVKNPKVPKVAMPEFLMETKSPAAKELYKEIKLVAPTNYSVILYGESGTGKEVMARSIHKQSARSAKPFIAVDCGTLRKDLARSELFGHVKGSFTGAVGDKPGSLELANKGTIFLDEIGNLSYEIQMLLLRAIQERKIRRLGADKDIDVDIRIIVASNENLQVLVKKGKFREDLYFRFNEFTIDVPSLRDRGSDIKMFAEFFLEQAKADLEKEITDFDEKVMEAFNKYYWPGNLREMRNVIRRAALLTQVSKIHMDVLPPEMIKALTHTNISELR
jgi:two-component system response regulator HydG